MTPILHLLCAGAAKGLVDALRETFREQTGAAIDGRFGAVGAMRDALLAGEPCDVMVTTDAVAAALAAEGRLDAAGRAPLGRVRTGIAVRRGEPRPDVSTADGLRAALLAADAIYFPDAVRSTAGSHFASVLRALGVDAVLAPRLRTHPNGATAMRELALSTAPRPIGCTQVTEINYTEGVVLVGPLPERFELATVYTAALAAATPQRALAAHWLGLLAGPASAALRTAGGFEP